MLIFRILKRQVIVEVYRPAYRTAAVSSASSTGFDGNIIKPADVYTIEIGLTHTECIDINSVPDHRSLGSCSSPKRRRRNHTQPVFFAIQMRVVLQNSRE